jgi:ubiquinone/menaquinone biosynthesis C-methylase UbiE
MSQETEIPFADRVLQGFEPEPPREHWLVTSLMKWADNDGKTPRRLYYPRTTSTDDEFREFEMQKTHYYFTNLKSGGVDLSILEGKDVLDVGCGSGGKPLAVTQQVKPKSMHGFDLPTVFDPEAAERFARSKGITNCTFSKGYAEEMSFADNSFDAVISDDVIEHVKDPEKVFQEIYRVLRPGGIAILKFPSYKMLTAHHYDAQINVPGMQYLLPYKTWAAGFNYLSQFPKYSFLGGRFPRAISTRYHSNITPFLNGIDLKGVKRGLAKTRFEIVQFTTLPYFINLARPSTTLLRRTALFVYNKVMPLLGIKEMLSTTLIMVLRKPN